MRTQDPNGDSAKSQLQPDFWRALEQKQCLRGFVFVLPEGLRAGHSCLPRMQVLATIWNGGGAGYDGDAK